MVVGEWGGGGTYGAVDVHGLVHVNDDKVVIPRLSTGELGAVQLGRLADDAQEGVDVGLFLGRSDVAPGGLGQSSIRTQVEAVDSPFLADLELLLGARLGLCDGGIDGGSALVLEVLDGVSLHGAQQEEPLQG